MRDARHKTSWAGRVVLSMPSFAYGRIARDRLFRGALSPGVSMTPPPMIQPHPIHKNAAKPAISFANERYQT